MPKPEDMVEGIPAGVRYVFDIHPDLGPDELLRPWIDIVFDEDGNPSVRIPKPVNTEGAALTVQATEDFADWSDTKLVPMAYDASDGTWKPADGSCPPRLFFRWKIDLE
jgi:hypothetical protein